MRPISFTYAPTVSSANAICLAQQAASGASLVINGALASGGVATMGDQQTVTFTTTENDSAVNVVITGTDKPGNAVTETLALPNSTVKSSVKYYYKITSLVVSGAVTANMTVGVNGLGASQCYPLDLYLTATKAVVAVTSVTGATYKLQYVYDDVYASTWPNATQVWFDHATMTGKTAFTDATLDNPVSGVRLVITAAANPQSISGRIIQSGE